MRKDWDPYMIARDRAGRRIDQGGRREGERIRTGSAAFNGRELRMVLGIGLGLGIILFEGTRSGFDFGMFASDPPAQAERTGAATGAADPFAAPGAPRAAAADGGAAPPPAMPPAASDARPATTPPAASLLRGVTVRPDAVRPIDGRSFALNGDLVRLADIDTPNLRAPCPHEAALGLRAAQRLAGLLRAAPFQISESFGRDADEEGRKLRIASRGGQSLGETMIADGLARPATGTAGAWCASGFGQL